MTQNTSHAVMSQRIEPHDSLDFFPTPLWATRALCEQLFPDSEAKQLSCLEPACGQGHMSRALNEYFGYVYASDIHDYGAGYVNDFLWPCDAPDVDWIITNPPFRLGMEFALTAIERARVGVAMLVRTAFLESAKRYDGLFKVRPPTDIMQFCERVPMFKGRVDQKGSTATAYCWLVWIKAFPNADPRFQWIEPCRAGLERPGDWA